MERKEHRAALLEDSHPLGVPLAGEVRLGGALECERGSRKGPGMNPIGAEGLSGADQNNVRLILTSAAQIH